MFDLDTIRRLFDYSDWANGAVLAAATPLPDEVLDREIDIGPSPGSLRRILIHTWNGERMWLWRFKGELDHKWPPERVQTPLPDLAAGFKTVAAEREAYFATVDNARLAVIQNYRDSKGSLFKARLGDMILQSLTHSTHHRAQAVNAIRRLGGTPIDLDYMGHIRVPAEEAK